MKTSSFPSALSRTTRTSLFLALAATALAGCGGSGTGGGDTSATPRITSQPKATTAAIGSPVTFSVSASGGSGVTYQWYKATQAIIGATSRSYTINSVAEGDYGTYSVRVYNDNGFTPSAGVTLSAPATGAPVITQQPSSVVVDAGAAATFSVTATGEGTLTYQWFKTGVEIAGETDRTLTIDPVASGDAATYFVRVTNDKGSTDSRPATLSFTNSSAPVILQQPTSREVNAGGSTTFRVQATGKAPLAYQWFKGSTEIVGETGTTLTIQNASSNDSGNYHVVVSNPVGSVTSATANLNVLIAPTIPEDGQPTPSSQAVAEGTTVTYTVSVFGNPTPTVQWFKNGTSGVVATGATLTLSNVTASDAGSYYAVATNRVGSARSITVTLTVQSPPRITDQPDDQTVALGGTATFTVAATGSPTLTYKWYKVGSTTVLSTGATLTVSSIADANYGYYYVVVTNGFGTATSTQAQLIKP